MQKQNASRASLSRNLIVVLLIALFAIALLLLALLAKPKQPDAPAQDSKAEAAEAFLYISVGGRIRQIEPLDQDRDVTISQPTGEVNVIHITKNGFHMASSTCDNQLCVGEGEVTVDNYRRRILGPYVLCLPNQVELQIVVPGATEAPQDADGPIDNY